MAELALFLTIYKLIYLQALAFRAICSAFMIDIQNVNRIFAG
jgi:hypothetical protein